MNQGLHFSIHNELMLHGLSKMQALFPYQSTLLIIACGDHITLRCIDARCMLECKIPAQIISAGTCVVAMGTLYDLMRTSPGMWDIECVSTHLCMRYSKGEYNLPITSDSIELAPIHYTTHWQISGATLHRLIKEASIASGTTVYRGIYLHYDTQNRCIAAVATDGVRMSCSRHYCEVSEASVMLGKEVCNVLSKWTEGAEVIICFANITDPIEIKWESADVFYQLRVNSIQSKFPNYLNTLNSISSAQRIKVRGQDLTAAINRNSLFSNDQLSKVVLEPGGDKLVIKSSSINLGSGHEIVAAQCVGSASWCVDAKVITDVANTDQEILIRGEASGPIQVCIKDEWIYVFMPILQSRL